MHSGQGGGNPMASGRLVKEERRLQGSDNTGASGWVVEGEGK